MNEYRNIYRKLKEEAKVNSFCFQNGTRIQTRNIG